MNFAKAESVETACWEMRLADRTRATTRAKIDELFNGFPPYSAAEAQQNNIVVNTNFLEPNKLAADARSQYQTALLSPSQYFTVKLDRGPQHKRQEWSEIITSQIRRAMKDGTSALKYIETIRNVAASLVLHGIGPAGWANTEEWCPSMHSIADVLVPSRTLVTMENLNYFAIYRRYTAAQLYDMTCRSEVDPGWNKDVVNACIKWALSQKQGNNSQTDFTYNPERIQEDFKENGFLWTTDQVPTVDVFDFYFKANDENETGWRRRMVLDSPSIREAQSLGDAKNILGQRGQFLYDSGTRVYSDSLSKIIHFQFADGSVVAPFRYHSVRSLGFLLYSICHMQNRLRCSLMEAGFESLLQYFRVSDPNQAERAIKVNLTNRGIIPDGVNFVRPEERWKVDINLAQTILGLNAKSIADSSSAYNQNVGLEDNGKQKTATEVAAEMNAATALVGAMLGQAYMYQKYQYREIARRFCIPNSRDSDVRSFRASCIKQGVPETYLDSDCWEISVDQIMGGGNRQLAIAQAQMLMQNIDRYDPDAQRQIMRDYTFAVTGDASKTNALVPAQPVEVTTSIHDAQLSAGSLLLGVSMGLKQGVNHAEYAGTLLQAMGDQIAKIQATGRPATVEEVAGLINIAGQTIEGQPVPGNGAANHIQILAQNDAAGPLVKQLGDMLGQNMNLVKAMSQQAMEAQQASPQNAGPGAVDAAKAKAILMQAEVKAEASRTAHAQKTAQRQQSHEMQIQQRASDAALNDQIKLQQAQTNTAAKDVETAASIRRSALEQQNNPAPGVE